MFFSNKDQIRGRDDENINFQRVCHVPIPQCSRTVCPPDRLCLPELWLTSEPPASTVLSIALGSLGWKWTDKRKQSAILKRSESLCFHRMTNLWASSEVMRVDYRSPWGFFRFCFFPVKDFLWEVFPRSMRVYVRPFETTVGLYK